MLKSFYTSYLQMMNRLEPLFLNWTGRREGTPKGVDETHHIVSLGIASYTVDICRYENLESLGKCFVPFVLMLLPSVFKGNTLKCAS